MITRISIKNFKALNNFEMADIGHFTCLIGLNGAGKSSFLQALDFISHLVLGDFSSWLSWRNWTKSDLLTKGSSKRIISIELDFLLNDRNAVTWTLQFNVDKELCSYEHIRAHYSSNTNIDYLRLEKNTLTAKDQFHSIEVKDLKYQGSILSAYEYKDSVIKELIEQIKGLKSLELLSPSALRSPSRNDGSLSIGGEGLPSFLSSLSAESMRRLVEDLHKFYPQFSALEIKRRRFGWKNLLIKEIDKHTFASAHINDGFLRILAILSQGYSRSSFLLFDEIENGINQELLGTLVEFLQNFKGKQVIVTTHSGLLLNFLSDSDAKASVFLLYKDSYSHSEAVRFFDISEVLSRLEFMGPGQVMSQTDLIKLGTELQNKNKIKDED